MERKLQKFSESLRIQEIVACEKITQSKEKNNLVKNGACFYHKLECLGIHSMGGVVLRGLASRVENITNKVSFTMSGIQQKISSHAKKKETMTHNKQKNQSIESDKELTWVLELAGDINIVICTLFHLHKKLNRDIESKEKDLNQTFWNEKLQYLR